MGKILKKEGLKSFVDGLLAKYEVIAPIKKQDINIFSRITSFDQMNLDFINTAYPAKELFLPAHENLFLFRSDNQKIKPTIDTTKRVLFGIRPCDVNSLLVIDRIFLDEHGDPYYKSRRDNTILIALNCAKAGDNCFCGSFNTNKLTTGFDLLLTETSKGHLAEIGSPRGEALINTSLFTDTDLKPDTRLTFRKEITDAMLTKLRNSFDNPIWAETAKNCLSCTACTVTCPTCPCFFIKDETNLDLKGGNRYRCSASCQLKSFTKVAGNTVFRKERGSRLKHRIFHQLIYYKDKFSSQMCVGCGRCYTNCPTKIDMVEISGRLK
jgi:sulfhydrogenase subunit beta (sulfur reductase)